jgi:hypothetical protein
MEPQSIGLVAGAVGVTTGLIGAYDKPGSSFVAVASQVALQTLLPLYALPRLTDFQLSAANGALMMLVAATFHGFSVDSSLKYGAIVSSVTYPAILLLGRAKKSEPQ